MKTQKSPWYKNPYWLGGIALGVVVIALVLFLALRSGGDKKSDTPDKPNIEEPTPTPAPEPEPTPEPEPDPEPAPTQGSYTEGEQTDGVWNLVLVNPWNPLPDGFSVDLEPLDGSRGVDKRCYPQLQK